MPDLSTIDPTKVTVTNDTISVPQAPTILSVDDINQAIDNAQTQVDDLTRQIADMQSQLTNFQTVITNGQALLAQLPQTVVPTPPTPSIPAQS